MDAQVETNNGGSAAGCMVVIAIVVIWLVVSAVGHFTVGPATVKMPDLIGSDCKSAQAKVDHLFERRRDTHQDDRMAGNSPGICTGNIVYKTDPRPGATVSLKDDDYVRTTWWAIEPEVYNWYLAHPRMPDFIGRSYRPRIGPGGPYTEYATEHGDERLLFVDGGYYEDGRHKILRTRPAPGKPLSIGQKIVFFTQVQRGAWVPLDDDGSGSSSDSSGHGGGISIGTCIGKWWLHVCVHS